MVCHDSQVTQMQSVPITGHCTVWTHSLSIVLAQATHWQLVQYNPAAKQSQYSFRHLDFLQWQCFEALQANQQT